MKKIKLVLILTMVCCLFAGCGEKQTASEKKANTEKDKQTEDIDDGLDHEQGLKSAKIVYSEDLTEEQKEVASYFDSNYLKPVISESYEIIQRYSDVLQGADFQLQGRVEKILKKDEDEYKLLVWLYSSLDMSWKGESETEYKEKHKDDYVVIHGKQENARWIVGDNVFFRGKFEGIKKVEVEGKKSEFPVFSTSRVVLMEDGAIDINAELYEKEEIKNIATTIFGENFTLRLPEMEETDDGEGFFDVGIDLRYGPIYVPGYVVELDNQKNLRFSKFLFSPCGNVLRNMENYNHGNAFEFSSDCLNFLSFETAVTDVYRNVRDLSIGYYDSRSLESLWKRDFSEIELYSYDYTSSILYLLANNTLYFIDIKTGEDMKEPIQLEMARKVYKLSDGILIVREEDPIDAIKKVDLNGQILWTLDNPHKLFDGGFGNLQVVGDYIILEASYLEEDEGSGATIRYYIINNTTGELEYDFKAIQ